MLAEKKAARKGLSAETEDIKDELVVKKEMKLSLDLQGADLEKRDMAKVKHKKQRR